MYKQSLHESRVIKGKLDADSKQRNMCKYVPIKPRARRIRGEGERKKRRREGKGTEKKKREGKVMRGKGLECYEREGKRREELQ